MKYQAWKNYGGALFLALILAATALVILIDARSAGAQANVIRVFGGGAYLGISMEDVTAETMAKYKLSKEMGVVVRSVEKGSPAEAATLLEDDVILEYAGIPVLSAAQISRLVDETPAGRSVELAVSRDGRRLNLTAKLERRAGSRLNVRPRIMTGENFVFDFPESPERGVFRFEGPAGSRSLGLMIPHDRPRLGVTLESLTDQMAEFLGVPGKTGALVTSVTKGSPAENKLRAGDVVVGADGKPVNNPNDLSRIVQGKKSGATLDLRVIRDKKEITLPVALEGETTRAGYKV